MKSEQERPTVKVHYEKPTAVDLGPTAPIVGASCVNGPRLDNGYCDSFGNSAAQCTDGNEAGVGCQHGDVGA